MAQGRKRTPSENKQVMGTWRPDRVAANEPKLVKSDPKPPCPTDEIVTKWFDRMVGYLKGENRASASHEAIIWLAARKCAEIEELDATIKALGRTYWKASRDGTSLKANPAVSQKSEAERHLQSLLAELGLTPASKSRVSADLPASDGDDWSGFDGPVN